ncbi:Ig domain-containing protein [Chloroflexota bacterium]
MNSAVVPLQNEFCIPVPLSSQTESMPSGTRLEAYTVILQATGGIPVYYWTAESGTLPSGLFLDSFTGIITGIPNQTGTFDFIVRVRDYDSINPGVVIPLSIMVTD